VNTQHQCASTRLRAFDYTSSGAHFVTICSAQKIALFGDVLEGETVLNELGNMVLETWNAIPDHFPNVTLDEFVVMPNHVHSIVQIHRPTVWAQHAAPIHGASPRLNVERGSLGAIVRAFKSAVTKRINEARGTPDVPVWQRNDHDRIIRDDRELEARRAYITNNPLEWRTDEYAVAA
jgi:REP element-mobilizing transposase RayT